VAKTQSFHNSLKNLAMEQPPLHTYPTVVDDEERNVFLMTTAGSLRDHHQGSEGTGGQLPSAGDNLLNLFLRYCHSLNGALSPTK
jgi:hypothetical protein